MIMTIETMREEGEGEGEEREGDKEIYERQIR